MPEPGAAAALKFAGISHVGKQGLGTFKLAEQQLGWMCTDPSMPKAVVTFTAQEVASAEWLRACGQGRGLLKLGCKGDVGASRFMGFRQEDMRSIKEHLKRHFGVGLVEKQVATEGWSWADWELEGDHELRLAVNGKVGIDVLVPELSQVSALGKNELNLEFQEAAVARDDEVIHEMRLFIPAGAPGEEALTAEQLRERLQQRATLSATGEAIERVRDITVVQPRGKHDFEFFQQAVKVHGKTQTYTIKYRSITRLFLLEMPTDTNVSFVIGLDQPLRQGQQLHHWLVLILDKERMVPVSMPKEKLQAFKMSTASMQMECHIVAHLFRNLSEKQVISSSSEFKELHPNNHSCMRCSHKTQSGFLFLLKKSLIFVTKPVIWIRYDDIESVDLCQSQMRRSSFDLVVRRKGSPAIEFSQLELAMRAAMFEFLQKVQVTIENFQDVQSLVSATSSRRKPSMPAPAPATRSSGSGARGSKKPEADAGGGPDEEEEDEDYEEAEDEPSSEDEEEEEPEEEEPQPKRPRRAK